MRTLVASLVIAGLLMGTAWLAVPTVQADAPYPETLIVCKLPFGDRTERMTRLQCQNMGGKDVESGEAADKGN